MMCHVPPRCNVPPGEVCRTFRFGPGRNRDSRRCPRPVTRPVLAIGRRMVLSISSFGVHRSGSSLLAASYSGWPFGYLASEPDIKWTRAVLLGIVPLLLMAHFAFVFGFALPHRWAGPALLLQMRFYFSYGPQFSLAILTGLAVASGFAPDVPRAGADNSSSSRLM